MTGRRKGTPCACSDDCGCSSSKGKCIRAINNISPDPNGDFNVNAGTGIIISGDENGIVIANGMPDPASLVAGDNIEINAIGDDLEIALTQDPVINGDLTVNGDIIQNGAAYETHAEHIYTADDYIIMRDGAISALSAGDYSGFQVKFYDGVNDGRLVIDNAGVARVGDVGDEQPLLTREEAANLNNGALLKWDSANQKAVDEGTVGSDTKPIKIVNGVATAVTNDLQTKLSLDLIATGSGYTVYKYGKVVAVNFNLIGPMQITGLPIAKGYFFTYLSGTTTPGVGTAIIRLNETTVDVYRQSTTEALLGSLIYLTE